MKHSDIEELARECGLIEPRDVWADLPADYTQALCSFAALTIEKSGHAEMLEVLKTTLGNIMSLGPAGALETVPMPFRVWADVVNSAILKAEQVSAMSAALQSGDRG